MPYCIDLVIKNSMTEEDIIDAAVERYQFTSGNRWFCACLYNSEACSNMNEELDILSMLVPFPIIIDGQGDELGDSFTGVWYQGKHLIKTWVPPDPAQMIIELKEGTGISTRV